MELDNAILPNLALHMEKELEEGLLRADLLPGWQHHPSPAVPGSPGGKGWGFAGEAFCDPVMQGESVFIHSSDYNSRRLEGSSAWKLK